MAKNHRAETVKAEIRQRLERYTFNAVARWAEAHEITAGPDPEPDPNRSLEIRRALRRLGRRPEV